MLAPVFLRETCLHECFYNSKKQQKCDVSLIDLLRIPVQRRPLLFCLFSKGMSEGALSPLLIHLLPLVYVTDGDPRSSPSLINKHTFWFPRKLPTRGSSSFCVLAVHLFFFFFFLSFFTPLPVECLCVLVRGSEWARVKSKFTQLTLTMLLFGSKARTWPRCQFTSVEGCGEESRREERRGEQREGRWPSRGPDNGIQRSASLACGQIRLKMNALNCNVKGKDGN